MGQKSASPLKLPPKTLDKARATTYLLGMDPIDALKLILMLAALGAAGLLAFAVMGGVDLGQNRKVLAQIYSVMLLLIIVPFVLGLIAG